ncbi:MAG TPA: hypothetical protein VFL91_18645 [Thermomicrobiales bacterium]|nr:hypothetical protein [Thermomicrobiales bacterium]
MQIDVYQGQELAATFAFRREPVYHGAAGEALRARVEAADARRNRDTGDLFARRQGETAATWVAHLLETILAHPGYEARVVGAAAAPFGRRPLPMRRAG